ncbi:hypothetical protein BOSEA31B_14556 [Hyphomicrobiales bacterium]|nr:hypothetical protein BOSEA31B_14556 [Hyphomicrobiales bacterium]CAH1701051.1 hypothetical protein BOSEA1005_20750 [Hyphomicrobiales bacterium]CAI0344110.1 hypothetical protein BO1005MUT1_310139 [Hyphomicrobiales bacterium]
MLLGRLRIAGSGRNRWVFLMMSPAYARPSLSRFDHTIAQVFSRQGHAIDLESRPKRNSVGLRRQPRPFPRHIKDIATDHGASGWALMPRQFTER